MKSIFFIGLLSLGMSCNTAATEPKSLTDLKIKKTALLDQLNEISNELKSVESAISTLDTLKRLMLSLIHI